LKIFISGGCKNGKSYFAQRLAREQSEGRMYYLATMRPCDNEDYERIQRHRKERYGWGFITIEQPVDILQCLNFCDINASFLLDSTTALLANEMFPAGNIVNLNAANKVTEDLTNLCKQINNIVIVSDYIYSDAILYEGLTEAYRKGLAFIDRKLAAICDVVLEIAFGNIIIHKGREVFRPFYEKIF